MDQTKERSTQVTVTFQYKGPTDTRPWDEGQVADLTFKVPYGTPVVTVPIPAVGDSVSLELQKNRISYKVLTRHFSYDEVEDNLLIAINIVVTDIDRDEMLARLKV
jgi:hypothetical protein